MSYSFRYKYSQFSDYILNLENPSKPTRLPQNLSIKQLSLRKKYSLKLAFLTLTLLLLFPYTFSVQALSATTANFIQGTEPYITFDKGITKVNKSEDLLRIILTDTTTTPATRITITTSDNTSTPDTPYVLPVSGQTFADVGMLIPIDVDTIELNELIRAPNNYWGDDDGDGLGEAGISATGNLSVVITDKNNQKINRNDALDICKSPYKMLISSTAGNLITQYGVPNKTTLSASSATYYIKPAGGAACFAKPDMTYAVGEYAGPASIWDPTKGFITQSTNTDTYHSNFPTTGTNGLYFDLEIVGVSQVLSWPSVTHNGITATIIPNDNGRSVRVKLTGPKATPEQMNASLPDKITRPTLPATFELVGSDGITTIKYGFVLKKWFIYRGVMTGTIDQSNWCNSLGYRQSTVADLTNTSGITDNGSSVIPGSLPPSGFNGYSRIIGTGLFSEWGNMSSYPDAGFIDVGGLGWRSDIVVANQFDILSINGKVATTDPLYNHYGLCTSP